MIYFIQNKTTKAIKIGYSKKPTSRLKHLQTATPDELILLGTMHGGLEHESDFLERFAKHRLQGEWFKGAIQSEVSAILAREAANPQQPKMNVLVWSDRDFNDQVDFVFCSDPVRQAIREKGHALVFQALDELHRTTPIGNVIIVAARGVPMLAAHWASQNNAKVYSYQPNWGRNGNGAMTKVGRQMLRSMFDSKMVLVFVTDKISSSTATFLKRAEKEGIPVLKKALPGEKQAAVPPEESTAPKRAQEPMIRS